MRAGSCEEAHLLYLLHDSRTQVGRQWLLRCHSRPYSRQQSCMTMPQVAFAALFYCLYVHCEHVQMHSKYPWTLQNTSRSVMRAA